MSFPILPPQEWYQIEYGGERVVHVDLVVEEGETLPDAIRDVLHLTPHPDVCRVIAPGHIRKIHLKLTFAARDPAVSDLAWSAKKGT